MATTKSPGRKTRPTNYHNIGVEGRYAALMIPEMNLINENRVTGVKVAPRPRDEHGLEEMEGLFSPTPGKPSSLKNVMRLRNGTSQSSEPMEIAESMLRASSYKRITASHHHLPRFSLSDPKRRLH